MLQFYRSNHLRLIFLGVLFKGSVNCQDIMFVTDKWMSVERNGMILTGENQSTRRKACPNAFLCSANSTATDLYQTWLFTVRGQWLTVWAIIRHFKWHFGSWYTAYFLTWDCALHRQCHQSVCISNVICCTVHSPMLKNTL